VCNGLIICLIEVRQIYLKNSSVSCIFREYGCIVSSFGATCFLFALQ